MMDLEISFFDEFIYFLFSASILPVRISCGHLDRITIIEAGIIGGTATPWNGGLLGLGLQGQLSARLHRCPYIPKDRKNSKEKFPHVSTSIKDTADNSAVTATTFS